MRRLELTQPEGVRWAPPRHNGTGVLVLAGSSGRLDAERARLIAGLGVLAQSIRWFGGRDQNPGPWHIPVETFLDRVVALRRVCDRVVLVGTSFGAEAALVTASLTQGVDAALAIAPSDVVWAGVTSDGRQVSHWIHDGRPLPFVGLAPDPTPRQHPPTYRPLYETSRRRATSAVLDAALIPVERIPEVTLVVGGDDKVWPSGLHADRIVERRTRHDLATTRVEDPTDRAPRRPPGRGGPSWRRLDAPRRDRPGGRPARGGSLAPADRARSSPVTEVTVLRESGHKRGRSCRRS